VNLFVYYQEIKRELKRIILYECRCNERLKVKGEGSTLLTYRDWVVGSTLLTYTGFRGPWGTGTPKDGDEIDRREVGK
jgi:hypothetical protein